MTVDAVQGVLSFNEYTAVPLAPKAVGGLFNLGGQVIAAVDLRVQLGLQAQSLDGTVMNVILRGDDEPVSLLVDRIGEVTRPRRTHAGPTAKLRLVLQHRLLLPKNSRRRWRASGGCPYRASRCLTLSRTSACACSRIHRFTGRS